MNRQDRTTQTDGQQHRYRTVYCLTVKDVLQLLSTLILPLMFGIFTVVITFHQQNTAREQRIEDRLEDRYKSHEQRKQELDIASMGRETQIKATKDQYQDEVLVEYIKEIADSLEKSNGSIMFDSIMATIARAKTLNTIRQLDGTRNSHVIRFLYEAGQLTTTNQSSALDISTVQLANIDKSVFKTVPKIGTLSLVGVLLRNCIINHTSLRDIDFSSTELDDIDFSSSELDSVQILSGRLKNVNFTSATFRHVNLSSTQLKNATFSSTELSNVNTAYAQLGEVKFSSAKPDYVHHTPSRLDDVDFSFSTLQQVDFHFAKLQDINCTSANFANVDFSSARLINVNFRHATLRNVEFSFAKLSYVDFSSAHLENVDFSSAELLEADFSVAQFVNVSFSSAALVSVTFMRTWMPQTSFVRARRLLAHFSNANMFMSTFAHANLKGTRFSTNVDLRLVNFTLANLQKTDFSETSITITYEQLNSALSLHDTQLPRGRLARDPNLIKNGYADCDSPLTGSWLLQTGRVIPIKSNEISSKCHFTLQSLDTGAIMLQRVKLSNIWNSHLWAYSHAVLNAKMGIGVSIQLNGINSIGKIVDQRNSSSIESNVMMRLQEAMQELEILVEFSAHTNATSINSSWCTDIELFIDYGTKFESLPRESPDIFRQDMHVIVCCKQEDPSNPHARLCRRRTDSYIES